jgi:hypothetical protein
MSSYCSATQTYTLDVPSGNQAIGNLMWRIMQERTSLDDRIHLHFGTSALLCDDEREREEHRDNVTVRYALKTLLTAMFPGDETGEESPPDE